jgi:HK97 family phage prohead protease
MPNSMETQRLGLPLQIKFSSASAAGSIEGYASTFGGAADSYGDVIRDGAFKNTIAEHRAAGTAPAFLWSHDAQLPIGVWTQMVEDAKGLRVDGKLAIDTQRGADAHSLMKLGALSLSIGYRAVKATALPKGMRQLDEVKVFEISAVAMPANTNARITSVKARPDIAELNDPRVLEHILREAGYSRSQAKAITHLGKAAFHPLDAAIAESTPARKLLAAKAAIDSAFSNRN